MRVHRGLTPVRGTLASVTGSLTDEDLLDALEDDAPNEPQRLPLPGVSGPRDHVDREQQRTRRVAMSLLLSVGAGDDDVERAMHKQFSINPRAVRRLKGEVLAQWDEEDAERKKHYKAAAIRRILSHIRRAAKNESFSAVAMLEKQLAEIQDTNAPKHIKVEADFRLSAAVLKVLEETDPVEVRRMIEEEGRRMMLGDGAKRAVIDAQGESVERETVAS